PRSCGQASREDRFCSKEYTGGGARGRSEGAVHTQVKSRATTPLEGLCHTEPEGYGCVVSDAELGDDFGTDGGDRIRTGSNGGERVGARTGAPGGPDIAEDVAGDPSEVDRQHADAPFHAGQRNPVFHSRREGPIAHL